MTDPIFVRPKDLTSHTVVDPDNVIVTVDLQNAAVTDPFYKMTLTEVLKGLYVLKTFTNAEILALYSVPFLLIPSPGADNRIIIKKVSYGMTSSGSVTPYSTNTKLRIITDTATLPQFTQDGILLSSVKRVCISNNARELTDIDAATDTIIVKNKGVFVDIDKGNPTGGNAANSLSILVEYDIYKIATGF